MIALWLGLLSAIGVVISAASLAVLAARLSGVPIRWIAFLVAAAVGAGCCAVAWLLGWTGVPAAFVAPLIALAAWFATTVTLAQRTAGDSVLRIALFAAVTTVLLFVPAAIIVWALWYDPFATGIGFLDFGAALPVGVVAGSAVLAVVLLERRRPVAGQKSFSGWAVLWPALSLWVGSIGWLVGLELALDRHTPTILLNALLMPVGAALALAIVDRARHRENSFGGVAIGILAGCVAATPAAGYVIPGIGVVVAVLAGALCGLLPRTPTVRIAGTLLIAGGASLLLLGAVAQDVSFIYTGQPEMLFTQGLTVLGGAVGGFVLGLIMWSLLRRRGRAYWVATSKR